MKKLAISVASLVAVVSWSGALLFSVAPDNAGTEPGLPVLTSRSKTSNSWVARAEAESPVYEASRTSRLAQALVEPQVLGVATVSGKSPARLTHEQVVDLVKPGVVSIINWIDGELSIPDFDIDLKTFKLVPRGDLDIHTIKANWNLYGSGFVVNPDGYIVTSAHVIAKDSVFNAMKKDVLDHWKDVAQYMQDEMPDKDYYDYQDWLDTAYGTDEASNKKIEKDIEAGVDRYVKDHLIDKSTQHIAVIDKTQKGQELPEGNEVVEAYRHGLPASIVDFDPGYKETQKDVAVIKIDERNVPAVALGTTGGLASGAKVLIMGYPYNAQISSGDLFEATLTQGVVGAIKDYKGQKVIQLDNKISPGSSGGPMLDEQGKVLGIVTYQTGEGLAGDDFGFALPVELVKEVLAKHNIIPELGVYGSNLLLGFESQDQSTCKKALENFTAAAGVSSRFPVNEHLSKYTGACQALISSGQSKDSAWDVMRIYLREHRANAFIFSALVLILLGFGLALIMKFLKHLHNAPPLVSMPPGAPHLS